jgi:hypothetical protein
VKITNLPDLAPTEVAQRLSSAGVRRARVETIGWSKRLGVEIHVRPRTDARSLVEIAVNALRALDVEPGANGWRYFAGAND